MRLISLQLHNFCQHRELDISFDPGLNLILGPNGSGKSNIIAAIQFAITGDLPIHTREQAICQGIPSNAECWVSLTFQHFEFFVTVKRSIRPTAHILTCVMHDSDAYSVELEGYTTVNDYILNLLDVQKKQLEEYVFIAQGALDALMNKTREQRALELAKIFGVADTEKIWEALGSKIARIEVPSAIDVVALEAAQHAQEQQVANATAQLSQVSQTQLSAEEKATIETAFEGQKLYESTLIAYYKTIDGLNAIQKRLRTFSSLELDRESLKQLRESVIVAEHKATEAQKELQNWAIYDQWHHQQALLDVRRKHVTQLITARPRVYPGYWTQLANAQQNYKTLSDLFHECEVNLHNIEMSIKSAVCHTCKRPFDNYTTIKKELARCKEKYAKLAAECEVLGRAIDVHDVRNNIRQAIREYRKNKQAIKPCNKPANSKNACAGIIDNLSAIRKDCKLLEDFMYDQELQESRLRGELDSNAKQCEALYNKLVSVQRIPRRILIYYKEILVNDAETRKTTQRLQSDVRQYEFELQTIRKQLADGIKINLQRKRLFEGKDYLLQLRELFHRSGVPKLLVDTYLDVVIEGVNEFLGLFNAPFRVRRNDDLGFDAIFAGHSKILPDKLLSGGQRIMLSLAFRIALNSQFTATLGLLSLDEPTVYLDADGRGCLPAILEKLREICQSNNTQVLFITHDSDLMNLGDHTIQLGA